MQISFKEGDILFELPIKKVDKDFRIKRLQKDDLSVLLTDIVGEAG